ncbi:hypothetical protein HYALB_00010041 [Hymenoscyphus albidus]|uniref:Folliculin-interacting protein N-terminal domain-containing protein n=1 Tax=Hymenoscyphus albidus TaxID=595503 RepID=A0A9N9Q5H7_9HELO|nr:hypothetical protein HYALB_00010041 [Hymenoscyphus albidus]
MSLLGKLLSGTGATTPKSKNPLDSHLEDQFTHNLLFPDSEALCHNDQIFPLSTETLLTPASITNFDVNGEIDLEMRDVRVIIMQEATPMTGLPTLLYDTHTPPPTSPTPDRQAPRNGSVFPPRPEARRSMSSARKPSVGQNARPAVVQQEQTPPAPPQRFGAFNRKPVHTMETGITETDGQRSLREYREEVTTFGNCIFGTSEVLAYKGTTCKMHLLKSPDHIPPYSSSYMGDMSSSFGGSSIRGSSKLSQSFTSDNYAQPSASAGYMSPSMTRGGDRKKVLVTRMFPVPLLNDEETDEDSASQTVTPTAGNVEPNESSGYPFPKVGVSTGSPKKVQPKQKRTPMYAVGLVIQLPSASHAPPSMPTSRSSFRGPSSYNEQESCPSSFNSTRRAGWSIVHGFGADSLEASYSTEVDDRVELVTKHWDIIMRTLSHMQGVATAALLPLLKQADVSSPMYRSPHVRTPSASVSISGKRVTEEIKPFKPPKTNAKLVQLTANCLMHVQVIHKEADLTRQRVLGGIKTSQVITCQGRWGIWREEARLVGKWAGSRDEGFFFFNLLTGFLGNHTEWLHSLGPSWYRQRHYQRHKSNKDDEICLPARTIIVSDNKLMARRLIFLLSSFLPPSQQLSHLRYRPSTSASFGACSQSPPNYVVPILREEPLRRRINKKASDGRIIHPRTMGFPAETPQTPPHALESRRPSDATSIKTANLPIPGSDIGVRKTSAATTSTATPVTTMPHFSTRRPIRGTGPDPRPGSSGSLAAEDLTRALKRGDSSGHWSTTSMDSGAGSPWRFSIGSIFSGKRRSSTATTAELEPPTGTGPDTPASKGEKSRSKLAEMVQEAHLNSYAGRAQRQRDLRNSDGSSSTAKPDADGTENKPEEIAEQTIRVPERKPNPEGAYESPLKTSIDEDGIVDVDVPLPGDLSFDTAISSPSSTGYLPQLGLGHGLDGLEQYSREFDTSLNVGGWLHHYHPDFSLQAIPPQDALLEEVKASMRDEPTPVLSSTPLPDNGHPDRWVDICSAIIADTTNFSIKRIRYRRLVKPRDVTQATNANGANTSRYGNVYSAAQLTPGAGIYGPPIEERFIEEPIIAMDETLIQAVEKIIAQSGQTSTTSSLCSSRSTSRKANSLRTGGNRDRSNSDAKTATVPEHKLEVPRTECSKLLLNALETVAKEVEESVKRGEDSVLERTENHLREGVRNWLVNIETME